MRRKISKAMCEWVGTWERATLRGHSVNLIVKSYLVPCTFVLFFAAPEVRACMSSAKSSLLSAEVAKRFQAKKKRNPASALLKFADGHSAPSWESRLGNLLLEWKEKNAKAVLSLPVAIARSSYHPFGDGQSNAKMGLGSWKESSFPVVGIETQKPNGNSSREYIFHPSLHITNFNESKLGPKIYKVVPAGWEDAFYFNFNSNVQPISQLLCGISEGARTFSEQRMAPDPAKVGKSISGAEKILNRHLGTGYNNAAWPDTNVHGRFPNKEGEATALGGVVTKGLVDKSFGPFKQLYTCFEARNIAAERESGIPSGAGWHHIGDPAETILNNLETLSLPVAVGRTHGFEKAAYGLSESITATWLGSDEFLLTPKEEFHWYLNPYEVAVCTEIWVHNCVPTLINQWGMQCD